LAQAEHGVARNCNRPGTGLTGSVNRLHPYTTWGFAAAWAPPAGADSD
jgi:hypothetical protein